MNGAIEARDDGTAGIWLAGVNCSCITSYLVGAVGTEQLVKLVQELSAALEARSALGDEAAEGWDLVSQLIAELDRVLIARDGGAHAQSSDQVHRELHAAEAKFDDWFYHTFIV